MKMSFKRLATLCVALALPGAAALLAPWPAQAAAPMARTQAPGFYRVMVGEFEVTALSDGTVALPVDQMLTGTTPAAVHAALKRNFQSAPLETSVNAYLVNTGTKLVLIDTGTADLFGPTLGKLPANLRAAGYSPEQVDEVYITHMHGDHIGGLLATGGGAAFPNAVVRADRRDAGFWLSTANLDKAKDADKDSFKGPQAAFAPYLQAGRFSPFDGDTDLVPGVRAHAAYGHTPGHTVYVVESRGRRLVVMGDLVHVAAVQFDRPAVTIAFDSDSKAAVAQRLKAFADAARTGDLVAGAHLPFPGIGHVRKDGAGYTWLPIPYGVIR